MQLFINAGAYLINPDVLGYIPADQPYDMTDLINQMIRSGKRVISFPIHEYWLDIGRYDELEKAQRDANFL